MFGNTLQSKPPSSFGLSSSLGLSSGLGSSLPSGVLFGSGLSLPLGLPSGSGLVLSDGLPSGVGSGCEPGLPFSPGVGVGLVLGAAGLPGVRSGRGVVVTVAVVLPSAPVLKVMVIWKGLPSCPVAGPRVITVPLGTLGVLTDAPGMLPSSFAVAFTYGVGLLSAFGPTILSNSD